MVYLTSIFMNYKFILNRIILLAIVDNIKDRPII